MHREAAGLQGIDASRPLIVLGLFYDKSMMSGSSNKYVLAGFGVFDKFVVVTMIMGILKGYCVPDSVVYYT